MVAGDRGVSHLAAFNIAAMKAVQQLFCFFYVARSANRAACQDNSCGKYGERFHNLKYRDALRVSIV